MITGGQRVLNDYFRMAYCAILYRRAGPPFFCGGPFNFPFRDGVKSSFDHCAIQAISCLPLYPPITELQYITMPGGRPKKDRTFFEGKRDAIFELYINQNKTLDELREYFGTEGCEFRYVANRDLNPELPTGRYLPLHPQSHHLFLYLLPSVRIITYLPPNRH